MKKVKKIEKIKEGDVVVVKEGWSLWNSEKLIGRIGVVIEPPTTSGLVIEW